MKSERGRLTFPLKYKELHGKRGWFAKQRDTFTGQIRTSAERYATREDLVAALAFGKHLWGLWHEPKQSTDRNRRRASKAV